MPGQPSPPGYPGCPRILLSPCMIGAPCEKKRLLVHKKVYQPVSKKALAGQPGGVLGKAVAACLVASLSRFASRVFSLRPVPACLLVTPEESFATVHRLPLMPLLTASATTCLPFPFLVSAGACPSMGAG